MLYALAYLYPSIGYCQGMGVIVASLLLVLTELDTFWTMCALIDNILPCAYFTETLYGLRCDQRVLRHLINTHLPDVDHVLNVNDIDINMITLNWMLTLFSSSLGMRLLTRLWDVMLCEQHTRVVFAVG